MTYRTLGPLAWIVGGMLGITGFAGDLVWPKGLDEIRAAHVRTNLHSGSASFALDGQRAIINATTPAYAWWSRWIEVRPYSRVRVCATAELAEVEGSPKAGVALGVKEPAASSETASGSQTAYLAVEIDTGDRDMIEVCASLGTSPSTPARGGVSFGPLRIETVAQQPLPVGAITVRVNEVSAPLDERIYSQFIEHLGRCIYGGIWAEMLEDRKFFYPIQSRFDPYGPGIRPTPGQPFPILRASPWAIVAGQVTMSTTAVFAARHVPLLAPGTEIRHPYLALETGRHYTGYLWARAEQQGGLISVALDHACGGVTRRRLGSSDYERLEFSFVCTNDSAEAALRIRVDGAPIRLGAVSLMPADHVHGMRRDTLELLRQLRAPIYRWPGGNFVSGYDWRDGIGDRDRRPPRANPAWTGIEPNDFGLHEFVRFCREVGAEPLVTVNTGFGDAHSAAALLEYANGHARTTHWGRLRAQHGSRDPFHIRYWCIGNEMWGSWQLGYMKPEHYQLKHNWVVDTMRRIDPSFIAIASGQIGPWDEGLLRNCADHMDWIAEHFYCGERVGVRSHIRQIPDSIRKRVQAHREYRRTIPTLTQRTIPIAFTEWNYWYGPHVFGELGTRYFLKDALGIAAGFHEFARNSDMVVAAFYAQTVNVIGAVKTSRTRAALETTGWALKLYRDHFLGRPVATESGPMLDAQAVRSPDDRRLILGVVNPWAEDLRVPLHIVGSPAPTAVRAWTLSGDDPLLYNDPDQGSPVQIRPYADIGTPAELHLPPLSATVVELDLSPQPTSALQK